MGSQYAGAAVFPADFFIPDDADPRNAASINVALEALGDRTVWLNRNPIRTVPNLAALRALTGIANGAIYYVVGYGLYYYSEPNGAAEAVPYVIAPPVGTGAWFHEVYALLNAASGLPTLDATSKIPLAKVHNAIIATEATGPVAATFSSTSTTFEAIPGMALTVNAVPGDVLFIQAHLQVIIDAGLGTYATDVADGAGGVSYLIGFNVPSAAGTLPSAISHSFKYVVTTGGVVTIKGVVKTDSGAHKLTVSGDGYLTVQQIRP